jgi:glutathione S-transferase
MKLYYKPNSCSLAPHIALREAGLDFSLEAVDLSTKKTQYGNDFLAINSKGSVPALVLDDGDVLTEGAVLLQYIADKVPAKKLLPEIGSSARWRAQEMLHYIATEIHKSYFPFFYQPFTQLLTQEQREVWFTLLTKKFDFLATILNQQEYLLDEYSVADIYFYVTCTWGKFIGFDVHRWTSISRWMERMEERPAVRNALEAEGLLKKDVALN